MKYQKQHYKGEPTHRQTILDYLTKHGQMSMSRMCDELQIDASTASNNLRALIEQGKVSKFKSGMNTIFVLEISGGAIKGNCCVCGKETERQQIPYREKSFTYLCSDKCWKYTKDNPKA